MFYFVNLLLLLPIFIENESLREEIVKLKRRVADLEAENKHAKEEIEALIIINESFGNESDLQSTPAGSTISESNKSESEGELSDGDDGKSSSEIQPTQLSAKRSFDPKDARVSLIQIFTIFNCLRFFSFFYLLCLTFFSFFFVLTICLIFYLCWILNLVYD